MELISPSDIAYVLALIKNGNGVWDQDVRMVANPHGGGEKKLPLLFTEKIVWKECVDEGGVGILLHGGEKLEEGIHDKKLFSILCGESEHWELADDKLKDLLEHIGWKMTR